MSYYMLVSSLPPLPTSFEVDRCPITWPRLQSRLKMLSENDSRTLDILIDFLAWDRQTWEKSDAEVIRHYERVMTHLNSPILKRIVDDRINLRMIIGGFRQRKRNLGPSLPLGELGTTIVSHWSTPSWGLQGRFPWIIDLEKTFHSDSPLEVERVILSIHWRNWRRLAEQFTFSFEAVVLYLARWALINRWVSRNIQRGRERFEQSLSTLMDQHVQAIL